MDPPSEFFDRDSRASVSSLGRRRKELSSGISSEPHSDKPAMRPRSGKSAMFGCLRRGMLSAPVRRFLPWLDNLVTSFIASNNRLCPRRYRIRLDEALGQLTFKSIKLLLGELEMLDKPDHRRFVMIRSSPPCATRLVAWRARLLGALFGKRTPRY